MTASDTHSDPLSLKARIDAWSSEHAADFPPEVLNLFAAKTEEVVKSGIVERSIREGQKSPNFELPDSNGNRVRLQDRIEQGPVILSFYRGTWCPYCTLEFQALLETMPQVQDHGASILAVSPQVRDRRSDPDSSGFSDLCDEGNQVARSFGLVFPLGDEIRKVYHNFGIRLEDLNQDDSYEVPIPATYLIDRQSVIRFAYTNPDYTERAEPEALLNRLASLESN